MPGDYGGFGRGGMRRWKALGEYEANEHIAGLSQSGLSLSAYCKQKGVQRNALAEAIKTFRPDLFDTLVQTGPEGRGTGRKFEYSVKGIIERRGYFVIRQYASKSPIDMLAVGRDRPVLMIQAKKDGKLPFSEWNALWELAESAGAWPVLAVKGEVRGARFFRLTGPKEKKGLRQADFLVEFDPRDVRQESLFAAA